jgi:hypothetical protein
VHKLGIYSTHFFAILVHLWPEITQSDIAVGTNMVQMATNGIGVECEEDYIFKDLGTSQSLQNDEESSTRGSRYTIMPSSIIRSCW